jgi:hypothetical protein
MTRHCGIFHGADPSRVREARCTRLRRNEQTAHNRPPAPVDGNPGGVGRRVARRPVSHGATNRAAHHRADSHRRGVPLRLPRATNRHPGVPARPGVRGHRMASCAAPSRNVRQPQAIPPRSGQCECGPRVALRDPRSAACRVLRRRPAGAVRRRASRCSMEDGSRGYPRGIASAPARVVDSWCAVVVACGVLLAAAAVTAQQSDGTVTETVATRHDRDLNGRLTVSERVGTQHSLTDTEEVRSNCVQRMPRILGAETPCDAGRRRDGTRRRGTKRGSPPDVGHSLARLET